MRPLNQFGELTIQELGGRTQTFPTYTCGHCSDVVVMREDRIRERLSCLSCGRWLCEKKQICLAQCTPIHALADAHFENMGSHGRLVDAIMAGVSTVDEGIEKGLVAPF